MNHREIPEPLQLLIIEDNRFIRQGWEMTLGQTPDIQICGSFDSCEAAFATRAPDQAEMVLLDIGLPGMSGIDGIKYLLEKKTGMIIVICTVNEDDQNIFDALCAGAVGYLLKKTGPDELIKALREARQGGSPMTPSIARRVIDSFRRPVPGRAAADDNLTGREDQILQRMAMGKSYVTISQELFLSVDGVYYHIRHIYEKLQVHSRSQAIAEGYRRKIIRPPF